MNREEIFNYVKEKYKTIPNYPWKKYPSYAVLKHNNNKWYGIIMNISKDKLGILGNEEIDVLDIKCPPEIIGGLVKEKGFFSAYHMNKEHWITIALDKSINKEKIIQLIDLSYDLTNI